MTKIDINDIGVPAFVIDVSENGELSFAALNTVDQDVTGFRAEDVVGRRFDKCLPLDVARHISARYRECVERGTLHEYDELLDLQGAARWWRTTLTPLFDSTSGRVVQIVGVAVEITERKSLEETLENAALADPLTGVSNRRRLDIEIDNAIAQAVYTNELFGLIVIDLDRFKAVNDTFGHQKGDAVLRHIASLLSLTTRKHEIVARIGGDEFALIVRARSTRNSQPRSLCFGTSLT